MSAPPPWQKAGKLVEMVEEPATGTAELITLRSIAGFCIGK
jgi:hypothetical protein